MDSIRAGYWVQVAANVGILAGLLMVGIQINQNSELVREQLDHATWTDNLNLHLAMMGENPAFISDKPSRASE